MANHPWVIVLQFVFINCLHTSSAFFLGSTRVALRKGHISPSRWDVAPQTSSLDSSGSSGLGGSLSYIAGGFPQRDFSTSRASLAVQNEDHNKRNRNDPLRLMDVFQEVEVRWSGGPTGKRISRVHIALLKKMIATFPHDAHQKGYRGYSNTGCLTILPARWSWISVGFMCGLRALLVLSRKSSELPIHVDARGDACSWLLVLGLRNAARVRSKMSDIVHVECNVMGIQAHTYLVCSVNLDE